MTKYFDVYKSSKGYYVKEDVCRDFGINTSETRDIKGVTYYKIPEETIDSIEETTKNEAIQYKRNELALFDLQITLTLKILLDKKSNKKYINQINANKFNVIGNKRTIDKDVYVEITDSKIQDIIESTKNDTIVYQVSYEEVELEAEKKPAKYLFLYYHDLYTNTLYVTREILDLIRGLNIELDTTPMIIDNRNCYSITPEKLKEFEVKSVDFRGVEKLIKIDNKPEDPKKIFNEDEPFMPYNEGISTITNEIDSFIPYNDQLSTVLDDSSVAYRIKYEISKALNNFFIKKPFAFVYDPFMPYKEDITTIVDEDEPFMPYKDGISTITEAFVPYNNLLSTVQEEFIPYDNRISTIIDEKELEAIKENVKEEIKKYLNKKIHEEKFIPYDEDISTVYDESLLANRIRHELNKVLKRSIYKEKKPFIIPSNDMSKVKDYNKVIIYKDINTGKLYIPEACAKNKNNPKTILNKNCYETTIEELETIYNTKFLIIGVSIKPKKHLTIIICNNDGELYISNNILKQFNITSNYSKMILVNKEIYTQIGNEELDKLEQTELDNTEITIEIRKIVKINK